MKSLEKLVRELDIPDLTAEAWTVEMKKVEWRFMLEHGIVPSKIPGMIQDRHNRLNHDLEDDWVRLMTVKPYIFRNQ